MRYKPCALSWTGCKLTCVTRKNALPRRVSRCALHHAELCGAGFGAGEVLLDEALEVFSGAAQLGMAEA